MSFLEAKCTQCGAFITVDDTKDAGICEYCGNAFVTEKAIKYYNEGFLDTNLTQPVEREKVVDSKKMFIGNVEVTNEQLSQISLCIKRGEKILAIKLVRDLTGFGLEKCKNFIENIDSLDLHNPQDLTQFTSNRNATTNTTTTTTRNTNISTNTNTNTSANTQSTKSGGCYVATAIYGSYDCPQVWTLRRYRDNTLAKTWYGRAFIRTYYAISPTFVKCFGNTKLFKRILQSKLDRMVAKLQENGIESTFYEDKNW